MHFHHERYENIESKIQTLNLFNNRIDSLKHYNAMGSTEKE